MERKINYSRIDDFLGSVLVLSSYLAKPKPKLQVVVVSTSLFC